MAPSSFGVADTKKKKSPVAVKDPIVGMKINKLYSIGSFLGEGAFGKVYTIKNNQNGNDKEWAVKIVPHSSVTLTTKKNKASTPSDRLHYEHLMYLQQLRHLCGTILPNLPTHHLHQLNCFYPSIRNENGTVNDNTGMSLCLS
jgi:serine/threonine protein kinase